LKSSLSILTALAASLLLTTGAPAQTAAAKPAAKPVAKASKPAARTPPKKTAPVETPLAKAEGEQLAAAAMTHFGDYACEFDQSINVNVTPKNDGYVDVRFKAQTWTMKPVLSSTGALRLEDVKGRMLMLQIANKSMLMDTQLGQRVVDGCVHEKQRLATAAAAGQPPAAGLLQGSAAAVQAPR
jgi:Flp pilus assembly protein TadG